MTTPAELLEALPAAVYLTDADGRLTFYNDAAAELWGWRPQLGTAQFCGSWRLSWPDGRPMRHDECPMAITLREGRPCLGREAIAERPDGSHVYFRPYPNVLKDASGNVIGGINLLMDTTSQKEAEIASARLAAIVASSDDAIVSKSLEGIITSWNAAASRIFGYQPEEMIGQSIKKIIPPDLQPEEDEILAKLRRGERVEHFDTVRLSKDGRRLDISLTVSPVRDSSGRIIGASKVARDVSDRKQHEQMQRLLIDELNHRVKNTLAMIQAIASQSMRTAASQRDFVDSFNGRVQALGRAHDLLVRREMKGTTLSELVGEQVMLGSADETRVSVSGPELMLEARIAVQLALVLHELATNARKHGALSIPSGRLDVSWDVDLPDRELRLHWRESGVPGVSAPRTRGFGTTLIERSLEANGGSGSVRYSAGGLACEIRLPLPENGGPDASEPKPRSAPEPLAQPAAGFKAELQGNRVLLVEDEPLVAMDMEAELTGLGLVVIGPASSVRTAVRLIEENDFEAALLDANLHGHSVERVAAALTEKGVPFAFATGYGREALPAAFRDAPVLGKPFDSQRLVATLVDLLSRGRTQSDVIPLRRPS